eukprot:290209-Chlamydomonas_euryale.AAC.2
MSGCAVDVVCNQRHVVTHPRVRECATPIGCSSAKLAPRGPCVNRLAYGRSVSRRARLNPAAEGVVEQHTAPGWREGLSRIDSRSLPYLVSQRRPSEPGGPANGRGGCSCQRAGTRAEQLPAGHPSRQHPATPKATSHPHYSPVDRSLACFLHSGATLAYAQQLEACRKLSVTAARVARRLSSEREARAVWRPRPASLHPLGLAGLALRVTRGEAARAALRPAVRHGESLQQR